MKQIPLNQNKVALVDDEDYERISKYNWHAFSNKYTFYVSRHTWIGGKRTTVKLHREVLRLSDKSVQVDHINRDGLDNRKENLRICTTGQNRANSRMQKNNKSGYRGVYKKGNRWAAYVSNKPKRYHVGTFGTPEQAARAYDKVAKKHYGEFAQLNFPEEL